MTDDIKKRLQDNAEKCVQAYEAWHKNKKDSSAREALQDAIHEMRKVTSRLEIELATSENSETQKPMPIPQNRNAKGRGAKSNDGGDKPKKKPAPKKSEAPKEAPKDDGGEE